MAQDEKNTIVSQKRSWLAACHVYVGTLAADFVAWAPRAVLPEHLSAAPGVAAAAGALPANWYGCRVAQNRYLAKRSGTTPEAIKATLEKLEGVRY